MNTATHPGQTLGRTLALARGTELSAQRGPWALLRLGVATAALTVSAGAWAAASALPAGAALSAQALAAGGLEKQNRAAFDALYIRPGGQMASFQRLKLEPIEVEFASHWQPKQAGSQFPMKAQDRDALRQRVADLVQQQFRRVFQGESSTPPRLALVTEAGPQVLSLRARLTEVWLAAPHKLEPGLVHTYARSAGEMTLVAELTDTASGQVLARIQDQRQGRDIGRMVRMDGWATDAEIEDMAAHWAREIRRQLDAAPVAAR
jgi:hypothetical protein